MIEMDRPLVVIVAIAAIVGLELWRRTLRHRTAGWVHAVVLVLLAGLGGTVAWSQLALEHVARTFDDVSPAEKATYLARGISRAMNGVAIAAACAIIAFVVLAVASWRARRIPDGGPVARTR